MSSTIYTIIGYFLFSLPFLMLAFLCIRSIGWKGFFITFGIAGIIVALVGFGAYLIKLGVVK